MSGIEAILLPVFLILLSMLIIWRASEGFEAASEYIGRNLVDGVRGATINAVASSIPEMLTTFFFLLVLKEVDGFAGGLGTTAGSAIFNGMIIPALVVMVVFFVLKISAFSVSKRVILRDGLALILCETVLIIILSNQTQLGWIHGLILVGLYLAYLVYMFSAMTKPTPTKSTEAAQDANPGRATNRSVFRSVITLDLEALIIGQVKINGFRAWVLLLSATVIIGAACFTLVFATESLSHILNIPIYIVAVLLTASATSVPDTVISIRDAQKGNYDDAISNALGSNIFDITFALGLPLFLYGLLYDPIDISGAEDISELRFILLFLTIAAFAIYFLGKHMTIYKAILLIVLFLLFVSYILGKTFIPHQTPIQEISNFINGIL